MKDTIELTEEQKAYLDEVVKDITKAIKSTESCVQHNEFADKTVIVGYGGDMPDDI